MSTVEREDLDREHQVHQPRERSVPCQGCGRPTWRYHARCTACGGSVCVRCDPSTEDAGRTAHGPGVTEPDAWDQQFGRYFT